MNGKKKPNDPLFPLVGLNKDPLKPLITDPMGSYTGRPMDVTETPVQDADDL